MWGGGGEKETYSFHPKRLVCSMKLRLLSTSEKVSRRSEQTHT